MHSKPEIIYCVASPQGDIPVDDTNAHLPLEGDKTKTTYATYFQVIDKFIAQEDYLPLLKAINQRYQQSLELTDIKKIVIRSEKHGAFYHPASLEIITAKGKFAFGVNVATDKSKIIWLKKECKLLQQLNNEFSFNYLPQVYESRTINGMFLTLVEWFNGYHEFHLSLDKNQHPQIILWDFKKGYCYLTPAQAFAIYKQVAYILTLYYKLDTYNQIFPWHHAGGDFIAWIEGNKTDVKLTTVRGYDTIINFVDHRDINPIFALLYFFLNLTIRIRLDKFDGVGKIGWIDDFCLKAALSGFVEALIKKEKELKTVCQLSWTEFVQLLRSFTLKELTLLFERLLTLYQGKEGYSLIVQRLNNHIAALYNFIQAYPL
ncbi:MAG: hypothetical protein LWW94_08030 [Candidatus Desulfofervidaceae bacterium]|nr:hypothetical protein [Candidatus Desulfofervidaceae bacterium]